MGYKCGIGRFGHDSSHLYVDGGWGQTWHVTRYELMGKGRFCKGLGQRSGVLLVEAPVTGYEHYFLLQEHWLLIYFRDGHCCWSPLDEEKSLDKFVFQYLRPNLPPLRGCSYQ